MFDLKKATLRVSMLCLVAAVAAILAAGPASAASANDNFSASVASQSTDLGSFYIYGMEPLTSTMFNLTIGAQATWSGSLMTGLGWNTNDVRRGAALDVSRIAPLASGDIEVKWSVTGTVQPVFVNEETVDKTATKDVACMPQLTGGAYDCEATSGALYIVRMSGVPNGVYAKLKFSVKFTITPEGAIVTRGVSVGGNPVGSSANLSLTNSLLTDTVTIPCGGAPGADASYKLSPFHWTPATAVTQQPIMQIGLLDPVFGDIETPALHDGPYGAPFASNASFDLSGSGHTTDLGPVLANDVPPAIDPMGTFIGSEGTPIHFSADTTSPCAISSYVWHFSDGTTSYGPTPERAFKDNGLLDGQLTVTDETGLSATSSFTVAVVNAPPSVNAGPDTTSDWGRLVAFNGQATDPGADDQATLQYTWSFGDGTPSASGGPSATHAYAAPGSYVATLKVCDKDESPLTCPTDSARCS